MVDSRPTIAPGAAPATALNGKNTNAPGSERSCRGARRSCPPGEHVSHRPAAGKQPEERGNHAPHARLFTHASVSVLVCASAPPRGILHGFTSEGRFWHQSGLPQKPTEGEAAPTAKIDVFNVQ